MTTRFTPTTIIRQYRQRLIAGVLLMTFVTSSVYFLAMPDTSSATTTVEWNETNFGEGTMASTAQSSATDSVILDVTRAAVVDTTREDFAQGDNFSNPLAMTAYTEDDDIVINQGYGYTINSDPVAFDDSLGFINSVQKYGDVLYVNTRYQGLYMIDTKGTIEPDDDAFIRHYNSASTPTVSIFARNVVVDDGLTYLASDNGIYVLDTESNTLVAKYDTGSTPALNHPRVRNVKKVGNYIYAATSAGLSVISTQGTATSTDDTLVTRYHTGSTPALLSNELWGVSVEGNILYINSNGGLTAIDTKGTSNPSDDTLVSHYNDTSFPAMETDVIQSSYLDGDILYISTSKGLSVIDTQGTATSTDDSFVTRYYTGSTPPLLGNFVSSVSVVGNFLYISTSEGLSVIDTQGTDSPTDDIVVNSYQQGGNPTLFSRYASKTIVADDVLFTLTGGALEVLTPSKYYTPGQFQSFPRRYATGVPTTTITLDATFADGQDVNLSYRTGSNSAVWRDDFNTMDNYAGDLYAFNSSFGLATVTNGILQVSDSIEQPKYGDFSIEPGFSANYFDINSVITARVRMVNVPEDTYLWMYIDDFWDSDSTTISDEWQLLKFKPGRTFTTIGFELYNGSTPLPDNATIELDYIQITTPDSMGNWSSWNACPNQTCILGDLGTSTYLQYKLDLSTSDTSTTPIVHSVSYNGDYESAGTYTSVEHEFNKSQDLLTFNADIVTSASTSIAFEYTTDEGDTWSSITPGANFPADTTAANFQWRATLTTADGRYTPIITSVSITVSPHQNETSTVLSKRISALGDISSPEAAAVLREHYPEYFENPDAPLAKEKAIVVLLTEVLRLFNLLKTTKIEEGGDV